MKKHLSKKSFWQSILSLFAAGFIIFLAVGSLDLEIGLVQDTWYNESTGKYTQESIIFPDFEPERITGYLDGLGRFHGPVFITTKGASGSIYEEVNMVHGVRNGVSKTTHPQIVYNVPGYVETVCYDMGKVIDCKKSLTSGTTYPSSFEELDYSYPWYRNKLIYLGHEKSFVEAYLDTMDMLLETYEFGPEEFDSCYNEVLDSLEETRFDTIYNLHGFLVLILGIDAYKSNEFRMSVFDRHKSEGQSLFSVMKTTYPGSLEQVILAGIAETDFERFCNEMDSLMDADDITWGPLDQADPYFVDSLDTRMYRAMNYILNYDLSGDETQSLKSMGQMALKAQTMQPWELGRMAGSLYSQAVIDSAVQNAALAVFGFMILSLEKGDIIQQAVRKVWMAKLGVVSLPTVTTAFESQPSPTSVILKGSVLEDGGAEVSERGMAWATHYNPTTNDQTKNSGTGLGSYAVTLDGLIDGGTYYARTYATNSAGTAYGNCYKLILSGAVGIDPIQSEFVNMKVYPNPASGFTIISFHVESSENMSLTIVNLKGQAVNHHDMGMLFSGKNTIELDLSGLPNGLYSCQLSSNGRIKGEQKILIVH